MLVAAARGPANLVTGLYRPPAADARPPARMQLIAFEIGTGTQQVFLGILDVVRGLYPGQRKIRTFRRVIRTWRLFVSHLRLASCYRRSADTA